MRSRVMPGSSPTMERREPVRRLKSVDLPTLGRPQMAKTGRSAAPLIDSRRWRAQGWTRGADRFVRSRLSCARFDGGVGFGGRGLDAAGCGAGLLALVGRQRGLLCLLRPGLCIHGFAGARAQLGRALALGFEARFVGSRGGPCCGRSVRGWLAVSGTFSMARRRLLS